MNTSNNNLLDFIIDRLDAIREYNRKHKGILLPIAVGVLALIVIVIALSAHMAKVKANRLAEEAEVEVESQISPDTVVIGVPEIALEEDAYPEVNQLIEKYYKAMAEGDVDTVRAINNNVDDTEAIRIQETAKYVDGYESIKVFTKVGPVEGTYLAYVSTELKFTDYDDPVPGMKAYYICTDENGSLYINDGEETDSVTNYIREASLQDDVKELNNTVAVAYNDMLANNEELMVFLVDLTETIDTAVGEALAQTEGSAEIVEEASGDEEETETESKVEKVITVKATTTVNVRSSDSETADKLGKALEGEEFKLIEKRGNGWSEIEYNGGSAFIKSEFLVDSSTEIIIPEETKEANNKPKEEKETKNTDSGSTKVVGKVMAIDNVRVRKTASEDGEKLATLYKGQKLDYIEELSNGWTKVKYNGDIAYVKSEYVKKQ